MDMLTQCHYDVTDIYNQQESVCPLNLEWHEILTLCMNNSVLSFQFQYNLYLFDPLKRKIVYKL